MLIFVGFVFIVGVQNVDTVTYQGSPVTQQLNGASLLYSLISATMSSVPRKNETNVTKALLRK
jgi:hypothetical protein